MYPHPTSFRSPLRQAAATIFALSYITTAVSGLAQDTSLVARMAANEVAARKQDVHFSYLSEERSSRTGGHLWREKVVETDDGPLRHLLAVDGRSLAGPDAKAEADRIAALVKDPAAFRRENEPHKDDETHAALLLELLPKAFLLTPDGEERGCTRFTFRPNPAFQPSSYEERAIHAMGGTVSLKQPMDRLCDLQARILTPVEFGFGLLGRIEPGGYFSLERVPVNATDWKSDRISVHLEGKILLMKTLTRQQDVVRTDIHVVPPHLSLLQAQQLAQP